MLCFRKRLFAYWTNPPAISYQGRAAVPQPSQLAWPKQSGTQRGVLTVSLYGLPLLKVCAWGWEHAAQLSHRRRSMPTELFAALWAATEASAGRCHPQVRLLGLGKCCAGLPSGSPIPCPFPYFDALVSRVFSCGRPPSSGREGSAVIDLPRMQAGRRCAGARYMRCQRGCALCKADDWLGHSAELSIR